MSHPLHSEELLFECHRGRVALIDIGGFLEEVQRVLNGQAGDTLRGTGRYSSVTEAIGPFRLRHTLETDRLTSKPDYSWEVEPVATVRGENVERALRLARTSAELSTASSRHRRP